MILISTTDFVLEIKAKSGVKCEGFSFMMQFQTMFNYAELMKKRIKVGMIIPCYENGVPIPEPQLKTTKNSFDEEDVDYDAQELYEYIQGKNRVLFKGFVRKGESFKFELGGSGNFIRFTTKGVEFINEFGHETEIHRIEDLVELGIELTKEAEKLIKGE